MTRRRKSPVKPVRTQPKRIPAAAIRKGRGILNRKPGDQPFAAEWATHKRGEVELEEAKYARSNGTGF